MEGLNAMAAAAVVSATRAESVSTGKQAAIVAAAVETFLQLGYERTSLDVIAERAGVAKQTIYNNFGDKRHLFDVALAHARAAADVGEEPTGMLLPSAVDLRADLVAVGMLGLKVMFAPSVAATRRLLISEVGARPELYQACGEDSLAGPRLVTWFAHRIEVLAAAGVLEVEDTALVARQFFGLISYEGQQASAYGTKPLSRRVSERISSQAADLILRAYAPREGR